MALNLSMVGRTILSRKQSVGISINFATRINRQNLGTCTSYCARYEPHPDRLKQIAESPSGWVPPADPPPNFPFAVDRTRMNNLPVYEVRKNGGTRIVTYVKHASGDLKELEKCLRCRLGNDLHYQINEITSMVKVKGKHKQEVLRWLKELGF